MNKREAVIHDTIDTCSNDTGYLRYIVQEYFKNVSDDEINALYDELMGEMELNYEDE